MKLTSFFIFSYLFIMPNNFATTDDQFSVEKISKLPAIGQRIAKKVVHRLKKKKLSNEKINSELNLILTSIEESSKYHFMKIAQDCAKDSFTYCNQNMSEKKLKRIASSGLQFTVTMECVKKNYRKYSKSCRETLLKNKVVH